MPDQDAIKSASPFGSSSCSESKIGAHYNGHLAFDNTLTVEHTQDSAPVCEIAQSHLETCSSVDGSRSDSPRSSQEIRRLAAPLSKEQLIEIIASAAAVSPAVRKIVQATALASPAARRIMIRNIHYSTTDEEFTMHFAQFGPLEDAAIVREKCGRSKGFGFVTFKDIDSMKRCLQSSLHLGGRKLFVKVAADPFSEFLADGELYPLSMSEGFVQVRQYRDEVHEGRSLYEICLTIAMPKT